MSSGSGSAATSPPRQRLTEAEFLAREAAYARAALARTWGETRNSLLASADPRLFARRRPWLALGVAVVGGFLTAGWLLRRGRLPDRDPSQAVPAAPAGGWWRFLDPFALALAEGLKTTLHDAALAFMASRKGPSGPCDPEPRA